ncbi:hypothetical protein [Pseudomonas sp. PSPC3-3]|uniref:hypothetical protein n=1 Tax=unclassified Pseudomonas TaxID=196821 RepID=UPI003CF6658B
MDRQIVYPGQILPETTLLQMAKDSMIGLAKLSAAVLGTSTVVNGFVVTPTGPASLQVVCGPGEVYSSNIIDNSAFSSLPADPYHLITKQGILLDAVTLSCSAPSTSGQSINYLIQVSFQETDSAPVLLPYYNSANPALPYSGMGNNGLTQNTSRKGSVVVSLKAGAPAVTGSQTTPAPDSGYVGVRVVTVAYGQTTITSASISQYSGAPILPTGILQSVQTGNTSFAIDSGSANAYTCNFAPAITGRSEGQVLRFKVNVSNTGASTFNDGFGVVPLVGAAHNALQGGELLSGGDAWVQWNTNLYGGAYILLLCTGAPEQVAPATQSQHAVQAARVGVAGGLGRRNILINARGSINVRGYVSGTATTAANQFTIDRWYVVTSGQNLTFGDSGGIRTLTAPAGGVMQSIRGENIAGGVYVLTWTGTATATVNGTAVANGGTVTLPAATNARIKFAGGTFSLPQLELGSVATVFDLPNDDQESLICARYFQAPGVQWNIVGNAAVANQPVMDALYSFPRMISTPAVSTFSTSAVNVSIGSVFATPSALVQTATSPAIGYSKYLFVIYTLDADFI